MNEAPFPSRFFPARLQRGATLIEVLVAALVLAIGLLGIAALQASALRNSQSSYERSQATILTYSLFDAIRADRANVAAYNTVGWLCDPPASPATLRDRQLADWMTALERDLGDTPNTCVSVHDCDADSCAVEVRWDDSRGTGADATPDTIAVATRL